MFKQHQIEQMWLSFTLGEVKQGIEEIDRHVEHEWLGSLEEASVTLYLNESQPRVALIEDVGYWVIPMGDDGIGFDYGDTSSGGIQLVDCIPYGSSKEEFKEQLLRNLNEMKRILEM